MPFCRTLSEGQQVIAELKHNGLSQRDGLKIICMAEIPSNALLADDFLKIFDGFSIGSNDLTQLTLGIDRDSAHPSLAPLFDESDPAVKQLIVKIVRAAIKRKKYIGICGQAPSDKPQFAEWLVRLGNTYIL